MPKFWQSIKGQATSKEQKPASKPVLNSTSVASLSIFTEDSRCASRGTSPPCRQAAPSPLMSPIHETVAVADLPILPPDHQDPHALFRPGWNFNNASHKGSLPSRGPTTGNQFGPQNTQSRHQRSAAAQRFPDDARQRHHEPLSYSQQAGPKQRQARKPPPLRTVASSPSLSARKDSKTSPMTPTKRPTLQGRNASYDSQFSSSTLYEPLPRPPLHKPLPPVPTVRQHSNPELPTISELSASKSPVSPSPGFDYKRAPPPYIEAQLPLLSVPEGPRRDTLSPRARIVMEVLSHMVELLRTQDEDSLMEFSNLVTSQARALHLDTLKDWQNSVSIRF